MVKKIIFDKAIQQWYEKNGYMLNLLVQISNSICNTNKSYRGQARLPWTEYAEQNNNKGPPGPCLNIKTVLSTYGDFHVKDIDGR